MSEYDALLEDGGSEYDALLDEPPPDQGPQPGHTAPAPAPQIATTDAMLLGEGQGMFGLGDEITSGARALRDTALTPERKWSDLLNLYRAYKSNMGRDIKAAQNQHPLAYMAGNIPMAMSTGIATAKAVPDALMKAAPVATNMVTNAAQSIAQRWGQDELTPGNVLADVAAGEAFAAPMRVAQHGVRRTVGDLAQLPQRAMEGTADWLGGTTIGKVLGSGADELGENASKRVADLRTAQQSYLTEAGKNAARAGVDDQALAVAKAAQEGRAEIGPDFQRLPKEMSNVFTDVADRNSRDAYKRFAPEALQFSEPGMAVTGMANGTIDQSALPGAQGAPQQLKQFLHPDPSMPMKIDAVNRQATGDTAADLDAFFARARELQGGLQAQAGADAAGAELGRIKTGRGALENIIGLGGGGSAGHGVGGPVGAMLGIAAGKQLGKGAFKAIDLAGTAGQHLAAAVPTVERLAVQGGALGRAARWVLEGDGATFAARLATLAQLPEFQSELDVPTENGNASVVP